MSDIFPTPSDQLQKESTDLVASIVNEKDPEKVKDLSELFDMNMRKKNIARLNKLSGLLNLVDDEIINRMSSTPEDFDNTELAKYLDVVQKSVTSVSGELNKTPAIQINQQTNEVNIVDASAFGDSESRRKVLGAVMELLNKAKQENDIIEVEDET